MVALLKDDGEFTPMPVVVDTAKFEQLKAAAVDENAESVPSLAKLIRKSRARFMTQSK
ncbi:MULTISPECIES: hypothetical protein [unclassified Rhizobium]|uniref:hypothetical protein n=1 Tax=unclassified Rhizobium TaxID=2613769 RepID=UPI00160066E9|nr:MULTISPECIES: hypothetical protein [unclassified Rhizobium]MBB1248267.1 hypothetical protein [Rhizobium sp. G21]MCV3765598.1 hypothetical protein [Rhizobium sp. TRM95796]